MLELEWLEPTSLSEVTQMLAQYQESGKLIAGGTWVTLVLKQRLLMPSALISLQRVPGLNEIRYIPGHGLSIGALVTHREMELSPIVRQHYPLLAQTFSQVANVRIRNQATVGGNLCDADYASDPPAAFMALNASVRALSTRGERNIPVRDLIVGHYATSLEADEVVTEIFVPDLPPSCYECYIKYRTRSHEDRPCIGVAVVVQLAPDGRCQDLQVVVGAVSKTPYKVEAALSNAHGEELSPSLIKAIAHDYAQAIEPLSDIRASGWYRRQIIEVFVRRAIEMALLAREHQKPIL